ncbi:hypothetical protein HK101_007337 [Irineochytrium annulatum]|nr:hypothetical protein HK101_007337 [Irineochytrium annulatum]
MLDTLPTDLLLYLLTHQAAGLSPTDLDRLSRTCRGLETVVLHPEHDVPLWRSVARRLCPGLTTDELRFMTYHDDTWRGLCRIVEGWRRWGGGSGGGQRGSVGPGRRVPVVGVDGGRGSSHDAGNVEQADDEGEIVGCTLCLSRDVRVSVHGRSTPTAIGASAPGVVMVSVETVDEGRRVGLVRPFGEEPPPVQWLSCMSGSDGRLGGGREAREDLGGSCHVVAGEVHRFEPDGSETVWRVGADTGKVWRVATHGSVLVIESGGGGGGGGRLRCFEEGVEGQRWVAKLRGGDGAPHIDVMSLAVNASVVVAAVLIGGGVQGQGGVGAADDDDSDVFRIEVRSVKDGSLIGNLKSVPYDFFMGMGFARCLLTDFFVVCDLGDRIGLWDLSTLEHLALLPLPSLPKTMAMGFAVTSDATRLLCSLYPSTLVVWDMTRPNLGAGVVPAQQHARYENGVGEIQSRLGRMPPPENRIDLEVQRANETSSEEKVGFWDRFVKENEQRLGMVVDNGCALVGPGFYVMRRRKRARDGAGQSLEEEGDVQKDVEVTYVEMSESRKWDYVHMCMT